MYNKVNKTTKAEKYGDKNKQAKKYEKNNKNKL